MIEFKYREYRRRTADGKTISVFRPSAKVTLIYEEKEETYNMLVDSGADVTIVPKSVGERLGLRITPDDKVVDIGGIGGEVPVVYRNVSIKIDDKRIAAKIGWVLVNTVPPILGREDVFDHFYVEFRQNEKVVRFKKT